MGIHVLSPRERAALKERVKVVIIANDYALTRKDMKARFPRLSPGMLKAINQELYSDPRAPGWNGFPLSRLLENGDVRKFSRSKKEAMAEIRKRMWGHMPEVRAKRDKEIM